MFQVASFEDWRTARLALLSQEKALQKQYEEVAKQRQALPMVRLAKDYTFQGDSGPITLRELFGKDKSQLIVYHYMFPPSYGEEGCPGCAFMAVNLPDERHMAERDTALAVVSLAPIDKIRRFRERNGWTFPWVSSGESSFNYDFHVSYSDDAKPARENWQPEGDVERAEQPALSVFKLGEDGEVYHTYSSYFALDSLAATYRFLDLTPGGRQEGSSGPAGFKLPAEYK
jgi:predicted dithiol-disulfide oxidoreductase (DUF899 family)